MSLMEFFLAEQNSFFSIALVLMLFISILEGITAIIGMGVSELLETFLPDFDLDISTPDTPQSILSKLLGWINVGKVPVLIIFVCFLTAFALVGYSLQYLALTLTSILWIKLIMVPAAFFISVPFVRLFTNVMRSIIPKDESSALKEESFVGQMATIILGKASKGSPAEAKITDHHGQTHYFMVQPESEEETFQQGEQVLLSQPAPSGFFAIRTQNSALQN